MHRPGVSEAAPLAHELVSAIRFGLSISLRVASTYPHRDDRIAVFGLCRSADGEPRSQRVIVIEPLRHCSQSSDTLARPGIRSRSARNPFRAAAAGGIHSAFGENEEANPPCGGPQKGFWDQRKWILGPAEMDSGASGNGFWDQRALLTEQWHTSTFNSGGESVFVGWCLNVHA